MNGLMCLALVALVVVAVVVVVVVAVAVERRKIFSKAPRTKNLLLFSPWREFEIASAKATTTATTVVT